jgi:hypothetical protein
VSDPTTLIRRALDAGVELRFADGQIKLVGKRAAVAEWAPRLRPHRQAVLDRVTESGRLTAQLMVAAMRRCDDFNDSEQARQAMRQDILATPLHLRQDLMDHFNQIAKDPKP